MASLILELFVSYYRLFSLYPVYLTFFFYLSFLCYSQVVRDNILGDSSFNFPFVVYFTNTEKNKIFQQNIGI